MLDRVAHPRVGVFPLEQISNELLPLESSTLTSPCHIYFDDRILLGIRAASHEIAYLANILRMYLFKYLHQRGKDSLFICSAAS